MEMFTAAATSGDGPASRMDAKNGRALQWREYERRGPGLFVCVAERHGHRGFQLSAEQRHTTLAGRVKCVRCRDACALLAAVADLAQRIAATPPPSLRITMANHLDNGVTCRCALVLLAAMQSDDEQQEAA